MRPRVPDLVLDDLQVDVVGPSSGSETQVNLFLRIVPGVGGHGVLEATGEVGPTGALVAMESPLVTPISYHKKGPVKDYLYIFTMTERSLGTVLRISTPRPYTPGRGEPVLNPGHRRCRTGLYWFTFGLGIVTGPLRQFRDRERAIC